MTNPKNKNHKIKLVINRRVPTNSNKSGPTKPKSKGKPGQTRRPQAIKYGIKVPNSVAEAKRLDEENGNTL